MKKLFPKPLSTAALGLLFTLPACVSLEQTAPPVEHLAVPTAGRSTVATGRNLYVTTCTKCHSAEPVRNYSWQEWQEEIMPPMAKKSKFQPEQTAATLAYVKAVLDSPPVPATGR